MSTVLDIDYFLVNLVAVNPPDAAWYHGEQPDGRIVDRDRPQLSVKQALTAS